MNESALPASADKAGRRRLRIIQPVLWLMSLVLSLGQIAPAHASDALEQWRQEAAHTRQLAENDAAQAYTQAQNLQAKLPEDATPADRARVLNLLSRIEIYLALTPKAGEHARLAFDIAQKNGDRIGQAEADMNIALNSVNAAQIDDLVKSTTHSLEILNGINQPALLGEALLRTAMMYRRLGQIEESVRMSVQAMEIARRSNDPLTLTYAYQGLGVSFEQSDRAKEALDNFTQMRHQAHAAHSKLLEAYALTAIGLLNAKLGNLQQGETSLREAITMFRTVNATTGLAHGLHALSNLLTTYYQHHAEALQLLNEVANIFERYPNKIGLWYTLNTRSSTYQSLGNLSAALADAELSYALATDIGLPLYKSGSAQRIAAIEAQLGHYRRAYTFSAEAAEQTAKANREKISSSVVELAQRYEFESKRRQIEELTRRNEQQTAELKQRRLQQRWLWTVLGGSLLMLAGFAYFLLRLRRSHAIIRSLNTSLEQRVQARTAELRQQARYLRTLIDSLPWWVWLKDTKSRYLAVNQAAANSCGLTTEEIVGKSDLDVRPRELAEAFLEDDREVMTSCHSKTVEEVQVVDDRKIWLETFKAPVLDEDGTVLGTVGFARNISERKAVEVAREAALAEAQRLARLRSEFLAQMSHELRTPLNGILGYAQILRRDKSLNERQQAGLSVIHQSGEHLLTLVNDTLDLAKIEAGKLDLYPSEINLERFLKTITEMIRIKSEQKNLEFSCEAGPALPDIIYADEKRLRQALLNLLANAVKFTERGTIQLRVRFSPPRCFRFEVCDTGIGIAIEQLDAIFRPFEQAGDAQLRLVGTGLGLAISRQFVRLMGGDIHVESNIGEGSRFWFEIELEHTTADITVTPASEKSIIGYEGERKTVLVVDDQQENRTVAIEMLGQLGFSTIEAVNGRDALEKAEAAKPDLILMDVIMPEMNGMEATKRLRQLPALAKIPVIALSASAFAIDEERYLAAEMNAFLPKPIELDRLLALMANLLKLTWIRDTSLQEAQSDANIPLLAPPMDEMEILYALARRGNMQDIQQRANYLTELDIRYRPFANQLHRLASMYQSKAITSFVEQYLKQKQAPQGYVSDS